VGWLGGAADLAAPLRCGGIRSRSRGEEGACEVRERGRDAAVLGSSTTARSVATERWRVADLLPGRWRETGARREGELGAAWFEFGKPQQTKTWKTGSGTVVSPISATTVRVTSAGRARVHDSIAVGLAAQQSARPLHQSS
jgi:hypothetical protein